MGRDDPKNKEEEKKSETCELSRKDKLAVFIAALESLLLPLIILVLILLVVAALLFILFPGH